MADIAMCKNETCPNKLSCYRFRAIPGKAQYYEEFKHENGRCEFFWYVTGYLNLKDHGEGLSLGNTQLIKEGTGDNLLTGDLPGDAKGESEGVENLPSFDGVDGCSSPSI